MWLLLGCFKSNVNEAFRISSPNAIFCIWWQRMCGWSVRVLPEFCILTHNVLRKALVKQKFLF